MEVEKSIDIISGGFRFIYQEFNGCLMIENHLGLKRILSICIVAILDKILGIEAGVRISLKAARCPLEVDQQTAENGSAICSGGPFEPPGIAYPPEVLTGHFTQVICSVGDVGVEEIAFVTDRGPPCSRPVDVRIYLAALFREWNVCFIHLFYRR